MQLNFTKLFKLLSQLRDVELIENSSSEILGNGK